MCDTSKKQSSEKSPYATNTLSGQYGCGDYRQEMILASLQRSLQNPDLDKNRKEEVRKQIKHLEEAMGL